MNRNCEACGEGFEARSPMAKYCSTIECKRRREAARKRGAVAIPFVVGSPSVESGESVESAALVELRAAGRADTSVGRTALALARRVDAMTGDTGSSAASVAKEFRATLEEAVRGTSQAASVGDDLRARREARMRGA